MPLTSKTPLLLLILSKRRSADDDHLRMRGIKMVVFKTLYLTFQELSIQNQILGSEAFTVIKSLAKQNPPPVLDPVKPKKRRGRPPKDCDGHYATGSVQQGTPDVSANISPGQLLVSQPCTVKNKSPPTILDPIKPKMRRGRPKGSRNKTLAEKGYKKDGPKERRNDPATQLILDTFYPSSFNGTSMSKRRCLRSDDVNKDDPFDLELQHCDQTNNQPASSKSIEF